MVYEQEGKRWIFYHDLFGRWQWTLLDDSGATLAQTTGSYETFCACVRDARKRGFRVMRARSKRVATLAG